MSAYCQTQGDTYRRWFFQADLGSPVRFPSTKHFFFLINNKTFGTVQMVCSVLYPTEVCRINIMKVKFCLCSESPRIVPRSNSQKIRCVQGTAAQSWIGRAHV